MTIDEEWLNKLDQSFDPGTTLVGPGARVPELWSDYLSDSNAERLFGARVELSKVADYFPVTVEALAKVIVDAFVVESPTYGLCRIFARQLRGQVYFGFSRAPAGFADVPRMPAWALYDQRAPSALRWVHNNVMDGLTDIYGFGGFMNSGQMRTMAHLRGVYGELPWYDEFSNDQDTDQIVEIFQSGGGGTLLINLNEDLSETFEPQALLVDAKAPRDESLKQVDLFPYLDTWMSIALAEAE